MPLLHVKSVHFWQSDLPNSVRNINIVARFNILLAMSIIPFPFYQMWYIFYHWFFQKYYFHVSLIFSFIRILYSSVLLILSICTHISSLTHTFIVNMGLNRNLLYRAERSYVELCMRFLFYPPRFSQCNNRVKITCCLGGIKMLKSFIYAMLGFKRRIYLLFLFVKGISCHKMAWGWYLLL